MSGFLLINTIIVRGLSTCGFDVPSWVGSTTNYMGSNRFGQLFLSKNYLIDKVSATKDCYRIHKRVTFYFKFVPSTYRNLLTQNNLKKRLMLRYPKRKQYQRLLSNRRRIHGHYSLNASIDCCLSSCSVCTFPCIFF